MIEKNAAKWTFHPTDSVLSREEIETSARIVREKTEEKKPFVPLFTLLADMRTKMGQQIQQLTETKEKYQKLLMQSQSIAQNSTLFALVSQSLFFSLSPLWS